ncbi:MAG: hypothetical protein GVY27_10150, partial [Deinococcus-Thermus bacterium]|nr:hypothetical protein [Deinococcota bacterium]
MATEQRGRTRAADGTILARAAWALLAILASGAALAHATLVFGTVTTEPSPPPAGEPFTLRLEMRDPVDAPVEDAVVFVEARPEAGGDTVASDRFAEVDSGVYRTELVLSEPGPWTLLFRDQTFRQEEAQATVTLRVGADVAAEPVSFIFPPTATGPTSLTTWLAWLIGLPLVAGAVVTVIVLRGGRSDPEAPGDDEDGAQRP